MHSILENVPHGTVDDEIGGAVDDKEEVADTDKDRDPDWALTASTGVKECNVRVENIFN